MLSISNNKNIYENLFLGVISSKVFLILIIFIQLKDLELKLKPKNFGIFYCNDSIKSLNELKVEEPLFIAYKLGNFEIYKYPIRYESSVGLKKWYVDFGNEKRNKPRLI